MADKNFVEYKADGALGYGTTPAARMLEVYVDFTESGNQLASASDVLNLFKLPAGTVVLAAGVEQVVAGSSGNTLLAQVGSTAMSATLASDAAVGTITANADVSGGAPVVMATADDFSLLSASGIRATGTVRAFVVVVQGKKDSPKPGLATRVQ